VSEPAPSPASWARCCFCGGEIPIGAAADTADEHARILTLDFAPGDEAAAFLAREQTFHCHRGCFRARLRDPAALLPFEEWPGLADEKAALDACAELASDLFLLPETLPFRDRLFASEPGRWMEAAVLAAGIAHAERRLVEIAARDANATLFVQHAPHPLDEAGEYALIIFSVPYYPWTTSVIQAREV
jgi:hypothetical protein